MVSPGQKEECEKCGGMKRQSRGKVMGWGGKEPFALFPKSFPLACSSLLRLFLVL